MRLFGSKSSDTRPRGTTTFFALALFVFASVVLVHGAHAASPLTLDANIAKTIGLSTMDIRTIVGLIIKSFLTLLGIIAVILVMYAGFLWMTAGGNDEKIKTAKRILTNAVIGLIIIISAYAIASFILGMLNGTSGGPSISSGGPAGAQQGFSSNRSGGVLGNGIISYHYPEPAQQNVPRNTKVAITFKKPLVLSTVLANYDDNGTYTLTDDRLCPGAPPCPTAPLISTLTKPTFGLNVENVKLISNDAMQPGGSGTIDQQFSTRYPTAAAVSTPLPVARFTVVIEPLTPTQDQSLVFKPVAPIGSPTADVNYRVALRGGDNGVKVWTMPPTGATPAVEDAFPRAYADGGYYWSFTTGTIIDTTPPKISAVVPFVTTIPGTPSTTVLDRNQLLQIYFNKAIDPTSSTGTVGAAGFSNLEFKAQCLSGTYGSSCVFNNGQQGTVSGELVIGNRNQTLEFTPNAPCEGVSENSCGDKVYCLPKNVDLTVRALAATISSSGPSAIDSNGIVDMADNSLDGNEDGTAQGPQPPAQTDPAGRPLDYFRNNPPDSTVLPTVSDTARWQYVVGSNVDLTVPKVTDLDPPSPPPESANYNAGPSNVPPGLTPSMTWSKVMSIDSMRTGVYDLLTGQYTPDNSTLVLRSRECAKTNASTACPSNPVTTCPCTVLDPPGFFVDSGIPIETPPGSQIYVTKTSFVHPGRPFYTANDLGYTDADIANYPNNIPVYAPIARAQIRDTKQNCFWPSAYTQCNAAGTSCCNRTATSDAQFLTDCAP